MREKEDGGMTREDHWMDTPLMQAAALEGIAENLVYSPLARLQAAMQAIELLHKHIDELEAGLRAAGPDTGSEN